MSLKSFVINVSLDVQAISCPGVFLCNNGHVSLQIYMLDTCVQTSSFKPCFPMVAQERFRFTKTFYIKHRLCDLQSQLCSEWLYMELVQWESCNCGNVLAYFQIELNELLYPNSDKGAITGVDLDLLMEPTKIFPGSIAPKVEISSRTTIDEVVCLCKNEWPATVVINPKVITSNGPRLKKRNKVVCHGPKQKEMLKGRRHRRCKEKPPFIVRHVDDNLLLRRPTLGAALPKCNCEKIISTVEKNVRVRELIKSSIKKSMKSIAAEREGLCQCGHKANTCGVCAKYEGIFPLSDQKTNYNIRTNLYDDDCACKDNKEGGYGNKKGITIKPTQLFPGDKRSSETLVNFDRTKNGFDYTDTITNILNDDLCGCTDDNQENYACGCTSGDVYDEGCGCLGKNPNKPKNSAVNNKKSKSAPQKGSGANNYCDCYSTNCSDSCYNRLFDQMSKPVEKMGEKVESAAHRLHERVSKTLQNIPKHLSNWTDDVLCFCAEDRIEMNNQKEKNDLKKFYRGLMNYECDF